MCEKASPLLYVTAFQLNENSVGLELQEIMKYLSLYVPFTVQHFASFFDVLAFFLETINLFSLSSEGNISMPLSL